MAKSKSERSKESLVTGVLCPNCGQQRSRKIETDNGYELKCTFCGHRWTPRADAD